jgi:hypothetical protein
MCFVQKESSKEIAHSYGAVDKNRLTYNQPFRGMQADLIGPLQVKEFVNARGSMIQIWLIHCPSLKKKICRLFRKIKKQHMYSLLSVQMKSEISERNRFLKTCWAPGKVELTGK